MLDKEEEKATPDVLISALDVPTPLMIDGVCRNRGRDGRGEREGSGETGEMRG